MLDHGTGPMQQRGRERGGERQAKERDSRDRGEAREGAMAIERQWSAG